MRRFFSGSFLFLSVGFWFPITSLSAEFVCEGNLCKNFPELITDLNGTLDQVESDYLQEILKNNTEAAFLTNVLSSNVGRGHVSRFQIGVGLSLAGGKRDNVTIESKNLKWENLPNGGFSMSPSVNLDFNLGWLLRRPGDSYWNRFSIYLHGMSVRFTESDLSFAGNMDERIRLATRIENYGGMIRWQAVQPKPFLGFLFTWNGFNLGAGAHRGSMESQVLVKNRNPQKLNWNSIDARWGGDANFDYRTNSRTYNADIRTGLGILNIFHLTVGGGMSWNSGETEILLRREGPFVLKTGSIASWEVPREFQELFPIDTTEESGIVGLRSSARGRSKKTLGYGILALEFQLLGLGLLIEGAYTNPSLAGGTVALRYSF